MNSLFLFDRIKMIGFKSQYETTVKSHIISAQKPLSLPIHLFLAAGLKSQVPDKNVVQRKESPP